MAQVFVRSYEKTFHGILKGHPGPCITNAAWHWWKPFKWGQQGCSHLKSATIGWKYSTMSLTCIYTGPRVTASMMAIRIWYVCWSVVISTICLTQFLEILFFISETILMDPTTTCYQHPCLSIGLYWLLLVTGGADFGQFSWSMRPHYHM